MGKKLYSKDKYRESKNCEVCGETYDWISLITARVSEEDRWAFGGKEFTHVCPECYLGLKDHKYMRGDLSLISTYRREVNNGSFNRCKS